MTVLIDPPAWPAHGRLWSHLASDSSYDELHVFARSVGIPMRAFEGDHYDVPQERYEMLLAAGAAPVASRDLLRALQRSGLRVPKRRGERVLLSTRDVPGLPVPSRLDLLSSALPAPRALTSFVAVLAVAGGGVSARLLLSPTEAGGWDLPGCSLAPDEDVAEAAATQLATEAGLAVHPGALRPCGHQRLTLLGPKPAGYAFAYPSSWLTFVVAQVDTAAARGMPSGAVRWVGFEAGRSMADPLWWPLVAEVALTAEAASDGGTRG